MMNGKTVTTASSKATIATIGPILTFASIMQTALRISEPKVHQQIQSASGAF
jgi:hypothetical protein